VDGHGSDVWLRRLYAAGDRGILRHLLQHGQSSTGMQSPSPEYGSNTNTQAWQVQGYSPHEPLAVQLLGSQLDVPPTKLQSGDFTVTCEGPDLFPGWEYSTVASKSSGVKVTPFVPGEQQSLQQLPVPRQFCISISALRVQGPLLQFSLSLPVRGKAPT
jgi:hypothetical protein